MIITPKEFFTLCSAAMAAIDPALAPEESFEELDAQGLAFAQLATKNLNDLITERLKNESGSTESAVAGSGTSA